MNQPPLNLITNSILRRYKTKTKGNTRASGLTWLRYRLDMDNGNDLISDNSNIGNSLSQSILKSCEKPELDKDDEQWNDYKRYLSLKVSKTTATNLFRYAKHYHYVIETRNASDLQLLTQEKRIHVMKALSSLSKFKGMHDEWKKLIEKFDLK